MIVNVVSFEAGVGIGGHCKETLLLPHYNIYVRGHGVAVITHTPPAFEVSSSKTRTLCWEVGSCLLMVSSTKC